MNELKTCACCGGEPILQVSKQVCFNKNGQQIGNLAKWKIRVKCTKCNLYNEKEYIDEANVETHEILSIYTEVIDKWNKRLNELSCYGPIATNFAKVDQTDQLEILLNYGLSNLSFRRVIRFVLYESNGWKFRNGMSEEYKVKVSDLTCLTRTELKRGRGIGDKTLQNIVDTLAEVGLRLKGEELLYCC